MAKHKIQTPASSVRSLDELSPDPANARTITGEAATGLRASLSKFGDIAGIVFNSKTGRLVTGHQRIARLRESGASMWHADTSGAYIMHPVTGERFPVRIVEWDEKTERAANLTANNPSIGGDFTADAVNQLGDLADLPDFSEFGLDILLESLGKEFPSPVTPVGEDDAPPLQERAISERGDLWVMGKHRLLCGDSQNAGDVTLIMAKERAVLMATDPPYGVDYAAAKDGIPRSGFKNIREDWGDMANDELKDDRLREFLENVFRAAADTAITENAAWYLWHAHLTAAFFAAAAAAAADVLLHRQIIWKKPGFVLTRSGMYHWAHECAYYGWRKGNQPPWYGTKSQTSVWEVGRDGDSGNHPTQKPIELFAIPMRNHVREGEVCYEPFSGSGSQIVAAEHLNRRCFAIEIEPRYVDVAVRRWQGLTGQEAKRESDGKTFNEIAGL